jgi:nitrous oxidase accessory protein NosD
MAAVRYFTNCLSTYPMHNTEKEKENDTIKQILHNDKYDRAILKKSAKQKMNKNKRRKKSQTRCVKFIYVAKRTKFIAKLFKNANLKISFKTKNTIGKLINNNKTINPNKFNKCGIYQLICQDCNRKIYGTDR